MSQAMERIWSKNGVAAWALSPLSWVFAAATGLRNLLFDWRVLRAHSLGLPTISVGNLSVGGTGKTPVAAWIAAELLASGERPAILLRGYGDDEPLVHAQLNPTVPVIANADRVAGAVLARQQGATVLVLDDAFQHRRAARDVDVVLVAAEQREARRLLPAGPLREGRAALRRATLLVVTRKSASLADADAAVAEWTGFAGAPASAVIALTPGELRPAELESGATAFPLGQLRGARVLAISAIGAPDAFENQLRTAGAQVEPARFPDHHPFSANDIAALAARAEGVDRVVCTLKDAVKLRGRWPAQALPVWYLSQAVEVERGEAALRQALARLGPAARGLTK